MMRVASLGSKAVARRGLNGSVSLCKQTRLFSVSGPDQSGAKSFEQQAQEAVLGMGLTVGSTLLETVSALRDLYTDGDGDEDETIGVSGDGCSRSEEEARAEIVKSLLRANHLA